MWWFTVPFLLHDNNMHIMHIDRHTMSFVLYNMHIMKEGSSGRDEELDSSIPPLWSDPSLLSYTTLSQPLRDSLEKHTWDQRILLLWLSLHQVLPIQVLDKKCHILNLPGRVIHDTYWFSISERSVKITWIYVNPFKGCSSATVSYPVRSPRPGQYGHTTQHARTICWNQTWFCTVGQIATPCTICFNIAVPYIIAPVFTWNIQNIFFKSP